MKYSMKNKVVITFNDQTTLESKGSSNGVIENDITQEMDWFSYVLPGYIRDTGKTMFDVKKVEIVMEYDHEIK